MKRTFSKGNDIQAKENPSKIPTFGIHMEYAYSNGRTGAHGNAIEVYTTEEDRDFILNALNNKEDR